MKGLTYRHKDALRVPFGTLSSRPQTRYGMTKAELVSILAKRTGVERNAVLVTIEAFMEEVKNSLEKGEDVHLRGFGSFVVKHRAQKTGRILSQNTTIVIPAHDVPSFKPADVFIDKVKNRVKQG
ncbi:MAG: integration host factor subunit beta [Flavobacteriales bacterium]|nr:integration host factor subunit beta [Flavobacteriales bacterium]MBK7083475.1 integration host factor subunit beta [Flavobacteriales bacterium]MBK7271054.1 integration host factor subunit beta [Flavobacteriales bacterium]MBK9076536.1 integration host factor subunit beta [Flavobacteriales bacterium]MBK9539587.1 integration host factor subunit beta [Flavobacteriales bacterium]